MYSFFVKQFAFVTQDELSKINKDESHYVHSTRFGHLRQLFLQEEQTPSYISCLAEQVD